MDGIWMAVLVAGAVGVLAFALKRFFSRSKPSSDLELGTISQSWLTEHRTGVKDRFD